MKKITTEYCKELLVGFVKNNKKIVANEFIPILIPEEIEKACNVKNWKRMSKIKTKTESFLGKEILVIERSFDCKPFDDQLRGYVYTNLEDTEVIRLYICGE